MHRVLSKCRHCAQVLEEAGPEGLTVTEIMERVRVHGFDWHENTRVGKSSISSTCGHDAIFLRLGAGRFTLRALPGAFANVDASASRSRQELEVRFCGLLAVKTEIKTVHLSVNISVNNTD